MSHLSPLPRSVYLLGDGMLFDEIIAHMLASINDLHLIKRVYNGEAAFVSEINGCQPDVILLSETNRFNSEKMLVLLSRLPSTTDLRIIVMSVKHKNIKIYDRPAGRINSWVGVPQTLHGIEDWSDLYRLVTGRHQPGAAD